MSITKKLVDLEKFERKFMDELFKKVTEIRDETYHEVCEKIRDQFIYKNNTKELDVDCDISTHRLNEFLRQIEDGVV